MTCRTSAPARLAPLASSMVLLLGAILAGCSGKDEPQPGKVLDEARLAGRTGASFPQADEDYFKDMDGGIALTPDEVRGRVTSLWAMNRFGFAPVSALGIGILAEQIGVVPMLAIGSMLLLALCAWIIVPARPLRELY